jgi:RHS repeat-associated protein
MTVTATASCRTRTSKFDGWNRLVQVKNSGGTTLSDYEYDGLGRRIQQTVSGTTTDLYYSSAWQVLEERVGGNATMSYAWSPVYVDAMIARDRDTDANGSLDERLYAMHDANFNVTGLVNTSGTVVERFANDPYGTPTYFDASYGSRGSSSYAWNYLHQGLRWDGTTGKYWNRMRDFDPVQGRFVENDPKTFRANDVNFVRYIGNSPSSSRDPAGLQSVAEIVWATNNPICAFSAREVTKEVNEIITQKFGVTKVTVNGEAIEVAVGHDDDTVYNAVKHCTWMCAVASLKTCSAAQAWDLGVAHETILRPGDNPPHSMQMDLHNNYCGIGLSKDGKSVEECFNDCLSLAKSYFLYWFKTARMANNPPSGILIPWGFPKWSLKDIGRKGDGPRGGRVIDNIPNFGEGDSCSPKYEGGPSRKVK